MRIRIDYADIKSQLGEDILENPNFSEIIVNYLQDNYFNGADSAVVFIYDNSYCEFVELELIPN